MVPPALLWRLEQEDQRLKKHDGRWIDIQRLRLLESFILTKLTKPSILVNLVGPQVSLPPRSVPTVRHFLVCEDVAGGSQQSGGKHIFREIRWPAWWVPIVRWRNNYFARNKEALPCYGRGPNCQPLHIQSTSDGSRTLTTLTTPR